MTARAMLAHPLEHVGAHELRQIVGDEAARERVERGFAGRSEREPCELRLRVAARQQPRFHRDDPRQRAQAGPRESPRADRVANEMTEAVGGRDGAVEIECGDDAVGHGNGKAMKCRGR
ncbi:hypothetical protein WJ02_09935 [Burkholderia vietnamiensis]|nr:hypothetical protein WJ02_09935 [Burkholderia vietnamiensis]